MKAAVFKGEGILEICEVSEPQLNADDEIIVKVEACGICGTDIHIMSVPPGYIATPNTILGHELCGRVSAVGKAVSRLKVGDRVVLNPNDYCCTCDACVNNMPNHCANIKAMGIHVDGGFAEYVKTTDKMAYIIPEDLSPTIAAFAEPLACAVNGMNKINVKPAEKVLVIGGGAIGLIFVQLMKASGAIVICSETSAVRRDYAIKCGADFVVNPLETDLKQYVQEKFSGLADAVVEVVGSQMVAAIDAVRRGGRVLLFGVNTTAIPSVIQSQITFKEISILGTWIANATFSRAVDILASGVLNLEHLVTDILSLEKLPEGIQELKKGNGIKTIINLM